MLKNEGYFLFTENLPNYDKNRNTFIIRKRDKIFSFLRNANLEVVKVIPMTIFLNKPLNSSKFLDKIFNFQNKILFRYKDKNYKEKAGNFLGFVFYWLDRALLPFIKNSPSNHMVICRKKK